MRRWSCTDVSTGASGGPPVGASFFDPGSSPGSPRDDADGDDSADIADPEGLSYTFATPGLHYVQLYSVYGDSTGIGYHVSLSGQWSQTPLYGAASTPPGTATSCPSSATLTAGDQGSSAWPVLYCGGTYAETWDGSGESDWVAFYTTVEDATVVVHYVSTGASGGPHVGASFFDPGSSPGSPRDDADGDDSGDIADPQGLSYTFATPGLHYVQLYSVYRRLDRDRLPGLAQRRVVTDAANRRDTAGTWHGEHEPRPSTVKVSSHEVSGRTVTLVLAASAAGSLKISGTGLTTVVKRLTKAGKVTVKVALSKRGTTLLRNHHDKLKLTIKVSLEPTAGAS